MQWTKHRRFSGSYKKQLLKFWRKQLIDSYKTADCWNRRVLMASGTLRGSRHFWDSSTSLPFCETWRQPYYHPFHCPSRYCLRGYLVPESWQRRHRLLSEIRWPVMNWLLVAGCLQWVCIVSTPTYTSSRALCSSCDDALEGDRVHQVVFVSSANDAFDTSFYCANEPVVFFCWKRRVFENSETPTLDESGIYWIALFLLVEEVAPLGGGKAKYFTQFTSPWDIRMQQIPKNLMKIEVFF